jgi:hypothetical protein
LGGGEEPRLARGESGRLWVDGRFIGGGENTRLPLLRDPARTLRGGDRRVPRGGDERVLRGGESLLERGGEILPRGGGECLRGEGGLGVRGADTGSVRRGGAEGGA